VPFCGKPPGLKPVSLPAQRFELFRCVRVRAADRPQRPRRRTDRRPAVLELTSTQLNGILSGITIFDS
jgi:hypothetical protein